MNNNTNEIDTMLETIRPIFDATQNVITEMKDGDRKPVKDIAEIVGLAISMEPIKVLPFVNFHLHNTATGRVSAGKRGGYIKGSQKKTTNTLEIVVENTSSNQETSKETNSNN